MKIIVTHNSPDLDAITSVWLIKRFLPGWEESVVEFVSAGDRVDGSFSTTEAIEDVSGNEVVHVDTGLGVFDHHQTEDTTICASSLVWDYIRNNRKLFINPESEKEKNLEEAVSRMVKVVVDVDHFKEVFWCNPTADYYEFSVVSLLDGTKLQKPDQDNYYVKFGMEFLDAILHSFENRIWAEKEIVKNGKKFKTSFGEGIAFDTLNDTVLKLAQKMGYSIVVRKDPRKGYVRIKARPFEPGQVDINLTPVYENLKQIDPQASWFLHSSKKMILNGSAKNARMKPSKLSIDEIIDIIKKI